MPVQKEPSSPKLTCRVCGRIIECSHTKLGIYRAIGSPECCGTPMELPPERQSENRLVARRFLRRGVRVRIHRTSPDSPPNICAAVMDISADGMGLRLTESVVAGDELRIDFCRADGSTVVTVAGQVRWCRGSRGSLFAAGLRFVRNLTLPELADLVH